MFVEPQTQLTTLGKSQEAQKVMGPLSTPTKGSEAPGGEPWTPTSNLKMLISAASPEIRNREKEKNSAEETENSSQVIVTIRKGSFSWHYLHTTYKVLVAQRSPYTLYLHVTGSHSYSSHF